MYHCLVLVLIIIITFIPFTTINAANDEIKVIINGIKLNFDQQPVMREGRILVPVRAIFESLGATVQWDAITKTVKATKEKKSVELTINSKIVYVDKKEIEIDVPGQIINGRTYVPLRFGAEGMGGTITWDNDTKTAKIDDYMKAKYENGELKNVTLSKISFYNTENGQAISGEKTYSESFGASGTKYVNMEATLLHSLPGKKLEVPIKVVYYTPNEKILKEIDIIHTIDAGANTSTIQASWGYDNEKWLIGTYSIKIFCGKQEISFAKFKITS